jgi:Zn-dependent M28 family amino/carboxypeptidase
MKPKPRPGASVPLVYGVMLVTRRDANICAVARALILASWSTVAWAQQPRREREPPPLTPALATVRATLIETHLDFLAHDLLEGRGPGTRGGELAARFVASQFSAIGLHGGAADGSMYQWLPLVGLTSEASIVIGAQRSTLVLDEGADFVARPERPDSIVSLDAPIVFVGHGITAPRWDWDDYKGSAQTGRVVMILANDPGAQDSAVFQGHAVTWYGSERYKLDQAARMGAAGVLLIYDQALVPVPWAALRDSWSAKHILLDQPPQRSLRFAAWITSDAARRIVEATGKDYAVLTRRAQMRVFSPIDVGARAAVDIRSRVQHFRSANVIARLSGTDSVLGHEAVVLTAHYDHLGIARPEHGDSIYNGAVENASGVSVLLAVANAVSHANRSPRRSVVFIATTASEEALGAQTYVSQPTVPLDRTAALINVDDANVWGPTRDIVADGASLSELDSSVTAAARAESLSVTPDPYVTLGDLYRGDQLPFAQAGVPVVLLRPGVERQGADLPGSSNPWLTYVAGQYDRPGDEVRPTFDYRGAVQQARFLIRLVWSLAQGNALPRWHDKTEFGSPGRTAPPLH